MIKSIYIKDFAIIDELRIEFKKGLSVFIGETGAGKSIIVGAIGFLCGQRADTSFIRQEKEKAIIEGVFSIDEDQKKLLDDAEIEYDEELIVFRTLANDGRSSIRVNGRSVTLNYLNKLLVNKIDIHSQKESQYLLHQQNHRELLDTYMNDDEAIADVQIAYDEYQRIKREYDDYLMQNDNENDIEYFKYQIDEIEKAELDPQEEGELIAFENRYRTLKRSIDHLTRAIDLYEEDNGISSRLYQIAKELVIDDDEITRLKEKIDNNYFELEDVFNSLREILAKIDISEDEINHNQERLFEINRIKRKYKGEIEDILKFKDELKQRVRAFEDRENTLKEYENKISSAKDNYTVCAEKLHGLRSNAASRLRQDIIEEMDGLELRYFDFKVDITKGDMTRSGIDEVSFLISTNKGEDLRPLIKVASGGEMSRIMLGLKAVFTKIANIESVIFDEIDTGVSGKAALAMGLKMCKISTTSQVIAITHLAQVVAFGDEVYFVSKDVDKEKTSSNITVLKDDEILNELAMMSSASKNSASLDAMRQLINDAKAMKEGLCK